jgi:hypothetical protein
MVFGGGRFGEGVDRPDGHADGAILDLVAHRWRVIARAPFKVIAPSAVWTGEEAIVLGGLPSCMVEDHGTRQCREAVTKSGSYDPAKDRWREFVVPARFKDFVDAHPLLWTGREALFLRGQQILAVTAGGQFRAIRLPIPITVGAACATATSVVVAHTAPAQDASNQAIRLQIFDPTHGTWTETSPLQDAGGAELICTAEDVLIVPRASTSISTTACYNTGNERWTTVTVPPLPGFVPCTATGTRDSCDIPRWSGHGRFVDTWLVGKAKTAGARYDPAADEWAPIAAGPDIQPLGDPGQVAWAGSLGATYATSHGPGSGEGETLLIYRPA